MKLSKTFFLICVAAAARSIAGILLRIETYCWNRAEEGVDALLDQHQQQYT